MASKKFADKQIALIVIILLAGLLLFGGSLPASPDSVFARLFGHNLEKQPPTGTVTLTVDPQPGS